MREARERIKQSPAAGWILHIAVKRKSQILAVNRGGSVAFSEERQHVPDKALAGSVNSSSRARELLGEVLLD